MSSIRLSPKHGVNPSVMVCFWCGEDMGVALLGMLKGGYDSKAPHRAVFDMEPCNKCVERMATGITFMEFDQKKGPTGTWCVVKEEEAVRQIIMEPFLADVLKTRKCYIEPADWDQIGLPRTEV